MGCIVPGLENSGCLQEGHTLGPRLVPTRALECAQAPGVTPHCGWRSNGGQEGLIGAAPGQKGARRQHGPLVCVCVCVRVCT